MVKIAAFENGNVTTNPQSPGTRLDSAVNAFRRFVRSIRPHPKSALQTLDEKWRSTLHNPIFGISFLDQNQRFIATNAAYQAMTGYTDDELRKLTPLDISIPGEREINRALFKELQEGRRQHYEMVKQLRRKDGRLIWVQLHVFAIPDAASGSRFALGMVLDITERKRAQDALRETSAELARIATMTRTGAITASIAHEINQPLGAVVTNADAGLRWLALATPNLEEARAALRRIVRDGHSAAEVIRGIRDRFRIGSKDRISVDVNEIIHEVVALADSELQKRPIVVHTKLAESLPPVMADRVQLQQVIFNLVTNSIDAMDLVAERNRILCVESSVNDKGDVLVTVADSGTGIEPEKLDRIFDTFFTTKPHGLGMGLSISRSIIEAHHGRLWAEPNTAHGAVFRLSLPGSRVGPPPHSSTADRASRPD